MLRLSALDAEDLEVVSAHMQDAVLHVGDMTFAPSRKQFALIANRFAWDADGARERRRTGLHFDRVLAAQSKDLPTGKKDAVLSLLAISFNPADGPSVEALLA